MTHPKWKLWHVAKVRADTLRKWLRWGMIDGDSDGRQVRLYQTTVEELRKNKWRPYVSLTLPNCHHQ
jgi:hypothetical protein